MRRRPGADGEGAGLHRLDYRTDAPSVGGGPAPGCARSPHPSCTVGGVRRMSLRVGTDSCEAGPRARGAELGTERAPGDFRFGPWEMSLCPAAKQGRPADLGRAGLPFGGRGRQFETTVRGGGLVEDVHVGVDSGEDVRRPPHVAPPVTCGVRRRTHRPVDGDGGRPVRRPVACSGDGADGRPTVGGRAPAGTAAGRPGPLARTGPDAVRRRTASASDGGVPGRGGHGGPRSGGDRGRRRRGPGRLGGCRPSEVGRVG